jgi:hypothetical protein
VEMDYEGAGTGGSIFGDPHPDGQVLVTGERFVACLVNGEGCEFGGG